MLAAEGPLAEISFHEEKAVANPKGQMRKIELNTPDRELNR
jgi:hypothetical protein